METLFARHKPKRGLVGLMLAGSLVLHGSFVGIASLWTPPQPPDHSIPGDWWVNTTEEGISVKPVAPPASTPSESPEATATPESVDVTAPTPPPSAEVDFAPPSEPTPSHRTVTTRTPSATNRPTSSTQSNTRSSAGPSGGGTPGNGRPAGVGGNWVMPHPPYPHMTNRSMAVGQTTVRVTTDASGRVSNVVIVQSTGNPVLDNHTLSYVRNNWHGPANASRTTQFVYELR